MTEICKICEQPSTPWQFIEELDGHICDNCSYLLADILVIMAGPNAAIEITKLIMKNRVSFQPDYCPDDLDATKICSACGALPSGVCGSKHNRPRLYKGER
jgi:hypothetical protein